MNRLIAQYVIRRLWCFLKDKNLPYLSTCYRSDMIDSRLCEMCQSHQSTEGLIYNFLGLITSALGGNTGWLPVDVREDFIRRANRRIEICTSLETPQRRGVNLS